MPAGSSLKLARNKLWSLDADAGGVSTESVDIELVSEGIDDIRPVGDVLARLGAAELEREAPGAGVEGPYIGPRTWRRDGDSSSLSRSRSLLSL